MQLGFYCFHVKLFTNKGKISFFLWNINIKYKKIQDYYTVIKKDTIYRKKRQNKLESFFQYDYNKSVQIYQLSKNCKSSNLFDLKLYRREALGMSRKVDVVVVGGGITGNAILFQLAKYDLRCVLLEKEPDIASGTTKSNSAIIHAGFDAKPGSLKAKMNVRGNQLYHELKDELDLDIQWKGSLVAATTDEEMDSIRDLLERGKTNGVEGLEIWSGEKVRSGEPHLSAAIKGALWAPSAGICCPFGTAIAFAENAELNGAEIIRECEVQGIEVRNGRVAAVHTDGETFETRYVVNAAGLRADEVSSMAGDSSFTIHPRKGEYVLFDREASKQMTQGVIFPTPSKTSKGILVCTTIDGNVFVGPNAQDMDDKDDTAVTPRGMDQILDAAKKLLPDIPVRAAITEFAGLRAIASTGDFVLGASDTVAGLLQAARIQSPGLTSAPAIGEYIADIIVKETKAAPRKDYHQGRPPRHVFRELSTAQRNKVITEDSRYGRVICRCETVTEGEIVDAIHRPCGARTVDGVKRRTRAGMGRCQGGFCGPRVTQILARELQIPVTEVRKEARDSYMFYDKEWNATNGGKA